MYGRQQQADEDDVVEQILSLTMMNTDYDLPSERDVLIEHAFEDVSTLDFSKVDYIINRGYSDAIDAMPKIKEPGSAAGSMPTRWPPGARPIGRRFRRCCSTGTRFRV